MKPGRWEYGRMVERVVELSGPPGSALLTVAIGLLLEAQSAGESTAWIGSPRSCFFPPDAAAAGVDLESLAVLRLPEARAAPRAAARLLQSGGFGLVVLDLVSYRVRVVVPMPLLTRMVGLVRKHHSALVVLTEKSAAEPSVGSIVSLRAEARLRRIPSPEVEIHVLKDKQGGPGEVFRYQVILPAGLREHPELRHPDSAAPPA